MMSTSLDKDDWLIMTYLTCDKQGCQQTPKKINHNHTSFILTAFDFTLHKNGSKVREMSEWLISNINYKKAYKPKIFHMLMLISWAGNQFPHARAQFEQQQSYKKKNTHKSKQFFKETNTMNGNRKPTQTEQTEAQRNVNKWNWFIK